MCSKPVCPSLILSKKFKIPSKELMYQEYKESSKFNEEDAFDDQKSLNGSQSGYFSILQRNYSKLLPIMKELHRCCVREDGEEQNIFDAKYNSKENSQNMDLK